MVQEVALARRGVWSLWRRKWRLIPTDHLLAGIKLVEMIEAVGGALSVFAVLRIEAPRGVAALPHLLKAREDMLAGKLWGLRTFFSPCRDREATVARDKGRLCWAWWMRTWLRRCWDTLSRIREAGVRSTRHMWDARLSWP